MSGKLLLRLEEETETMVEVPVEAGKELKKRAPRKKKVKETSIKVIEVPLERVGDTIHFTLNDVTYKIPYTHLHLVDVLFHDKYDDGIEIHWEGRKVCEDSGYVSTFNLGKMLALTQFL